MWIDINGLEQWVTIHGDGSRKPALLIVGGAGLALSRMASFFEPWEQAFTVVHWDQPGAGDSHARHGAEATGPITFDRLAADGIAVAAFIRAHVGTDRLILLGTSGGSIVGLKMVKARPDLFSAYVGTGQIVSWDRQRAAGYRSVVQRARETGDTAALAELESIGEPPYRDAATDVVLSKYANALTNTERAVFAGLDPRVTEGMRSADQRVQATAMHEMLRDAMSAFDARALGLRYEVPMFFFQGDQDTYTSTSDVAAFARDIVAPRKALALVEGGGHAALFLRDRFLQLLLAHAGRRM